jgi:hypothetical protein
MFVLDRKLNAPGLVRTFSIVGILQNGFTNRPFVFLRQSLPVKVADADIAAGRSM